MAKSNAVSDFNFLTHRNKAEGALLKLRETSEELAVAEAELKQLDDIHKTYLAKIALGIRDEHEKAPITIVDKMSLVTPEYEKFLVDLSARRHRFLKAKYRYQVASAGFELNRSIGSIAKSLIEKGL